MRKKYKLLINPEDEGGAILGFHKGQYVYCTKVKEPGYYPLQIVPIDNTIHEIGYVSHSAVVLVIDYIFEQL